MTMQRGARDRIARIAGSDAARLEVRISARGPATYDGSCFMLDGTGRLAGDDWMVFYNQHSCPGGGVEWSGIDGGASFAVDLAKVPESIAKLSFAITIDGPGSMRQAQGCSFEVLSGGAPVAECALSGGDFRSETAVVCLEIYRKPDWRIAAVMRGFDGGLGDLLRDYGGEEESGPSAPAPVPASVPAAPERREQVRTAPVQAAPVQAAPVQAAPVQAAPVQAAPVQAAPARGRISLEKKLEKAPGLISLAKPLTVCLEKNGLQDLIARVALVMDISGSMTQRYKKGVVQAVVNKTMPLAVQFDDDGNLDFWYYGNECRKMPDVTLGNYQAAVPPDWKSLMFALGGGNNEPRVIRSVVDFYKGTDLPVYVLFVTDGGVSSEHAIAKLLREASRLPLFWQFVGVGGSNYGVLERLDTMDGRYVDNAGFFALDDFMTVPDAELYDRLLHEFPSWLREARAKGLLAR